MRATLRGAARRARRDADDARQGRPASRRCSGPTLEDLRPGAARARPVACAQTRPFLIKTTPILRDQIRPFTRAALPTVKEARPALQRPRGGHAEPHAHVQGRQRAAQHARVQPAGHRQRGLPVLALVGEPHRRDGVRDAGRARPDPPRPHRAVLQHRAAARQSVASTNPAARHARRPPERPDVRADLPARPGEAAG